MRYAPLVLILIVWWMLYRNLKRSLRKSVFMDDTFQLDHSQSKKAYSDFAIMVISLIIVCVIASIIGLLLWLMYR